MIVMTTDDFLSWSGFCHRSTWNTKWIRIHTHDTSKKIQKTFNEPYVGHGHTTKMSRASINSCLFLPISFYRMHTHTRSRPTPIWSAKLDARERNKTMSSFLIPFRVFASMTNRAWKRSSSDLRSYAIISTPQITTTNISKESEEHYYKTIGIDMRDDGFMKIAVIRSIASFFSSSIRCLRARASTHTCIRSFVPYTTCLHLNCNS